MELSEAAELIDGMAKSIREKPSQFHFEIEISGTKATAIGGGVGLSVQARGGGPGSTTIGYQSTLSGASIEIAQKAANDAIRQEMSALVDVLGNLVAELRSASPDKKTHYGHLGFAQAKLDT
jgi:hypothetical protein